jgi:REP element-mobilizing transposase RayT
MKIRNVGTFSRKTTRLKNWDYRKDAIYFITMCTANREQFFGKIINGKMHLSNIGVLANVLWFEIKNHSKNVILDEFVVMPDHIHGIIIIEGNDRESSNFQDSPDFSVPSIGKGRDLPEGTGQINRVGTWHALSQRSSRIESSLSQREKRFQNIGKNSVSSIIGSYKSAVTKHSNRLGLEFKWQQRFYDRIIRDELELGNVRNYINRNIEKWEREKNQI